MSYKIIEFPGNNTSWEGDPIVKMINNGEDRRPHLSIKYHSDPLEHLEDKTIHTFTLLTFFNVIEYHWVSFDFIYPHFDDANDTAFALIEIEDSKWIEAMTSKSLYGVARAARPDHFPKVTLVHYRLTFDDYGKFDILASRFTHEEIKEETPA